MFRQTPLRRFKKVASQNGGLESFPKFIQKSNPTFANLIWLGDNVVNRHQVFHLKKKKKNVSSTKHSSQLQNYSTLHCKPSPCYFRKGERQTKTNQSCAIHQKWLWPVRQHSLRACQSPRRPQNICPSFRSLREKSPFQMVRFGGGEGLCGGGGGVSSAFAFLGMP
ncbi:hypothetical protein CEXT_394801 [Caerostris extrusa]|uniref:Uncharacterized protein n=1 Tax=Caerostris extrusa TaxID=172846 RepID=A0AAV4X943_CAEEX|nr:hypothetical protein CEXT_394801 [Caerostris extrusa]